MNKNRDIHLTLITWIIPVYNGERFIEQAIRSILNQPCKDLKVVVIDDGSEDLTAEIVKGINDDRVQYVYKENGGVSSARNMGIDYAESGYIAFLDADDVLCKEVYDEELRSLLKSFCYDMLSFSWFAADSNLKRGIRQNIDTGQKPNVYKHLCSYFFKTELLDSDPPLRFPEGIRYREDVTFMFLALSRAKKIKNFNRELFIYRNNILSAMHSLVLHKCFITDAVPAWYWCKGQCTRESDRNECDAWLFADATSYILYGCMCGIPVDEIQRKLDNPMVKETIQNYEALWNSRKMIWEEFMDHPNEYWKKMRRKGYFVSAARMLVHIPVIRSCWHRIKYRMDIGSFV